MFIISIICNISVIFIWRGFLYCNAKYFYSMKSKIIVATCLLGFILSCQRESNDYSAKLANSQQSKYIEEERNRKDEESSATDKNTIVQKYKNDKKIIKEGTLQIQTSSVSKSKQKMDTMLKQYQAYYESEDFTNSDFEMAYDLKLRIPSQNFENVMNAITQGNDIIVSKNIHARDVTNEFIDNETRLNTKKLYFEKYKEMMKQTNKMEDVMTLQNEIRSIHEEIEAMEGQLKYLNDQVDYSTLQIRLFETKDYTYRESRRISFYEKVKASFFNGGYLVVSFLYGIISIWPFVLLLIVVAIAYKRWKNKKATNTNLK